VSSKSTGPYLPAMLRRLPLYLCLLLLTQCSKCKNDPTPADPTGQLPPATQAGANTFGCLLDGQPWTPSGNDGRANYRVSYDPGYSGGSLTLRVYRYLGNTGKRQSFIIGGDSINRVGAYSFDSPSRYTVYLFDTAKSSPCDSFYDSPGTMTRGRLTITRLDLSRGIIAGTFAFTLHQPGCDSARVTLGRFDKRL